jgi:hypothetical protein
MTDLQMLRQERDAAWMATPNRWTNWPVLTVVRLADHKVGLMREEGAATVYVGVNLFLLHTGPLLEQLVKLSEDIQTYDSFAECAVEWRVD